jgi:uncharacterized membrane protein YdjX (TVP38/TMEM64 family)
MLQMSDHEHVSPLARRGVLVGSGVLFTLGTIGSNLGPAWVDERPAVVLALSSRNRNLFGSVPFIDIMPYAVIGFVRILLAAVVLFYLGRWYGQRAITWTETRVGELPPIYRWIQNGVDRIGWLLVILMPGSNIVCIMAGHRRMAPRVFVPLVSIGIALKLAVLWAGGKALEDQIRDFLDWIEGYQWWIVGGLFALSFLQSGRQARRSIPDVIHEIEHPTDEPEADQASDGEPGSTSHGSTT